MIRLNDEETQELRRVAKNVNQKIRRASKRGQKDLPNLVSVRDLKAQFVNKKDLKKEVEQLKGMLNNKEALRRHQTKEGTISNWRFDYIKANLRSTKKYINREIERQRFILKDYPDHLYAIREKINKLIDERDVINQELDTLSAQQLRTVGTVVDRYKRRNLKTIAGRNYFMKNLDALLQARGMGLDERRRIKDKLDEMTNEEFEEFYERHDIVSEIMSSIDSYEEDKLSDKDRFELAEKALEDENLSQSMDEFEKNADTYIKEAKQKVKETDLLFDASTQEWVSKDEYEKRVFKGIRKGTF